MFSILSAIFALGYFTTGATLHDAGTLFATPSIWGLTVALVLFCTVGNFLIMNAWQRCVSATEAGVIYCLEPVIATALSAFLPGWISAVAAVSYPNETLSWNLLAGGTLVVAATVLVATEKRAA